MSKEVNPASGCTGPSDCSALSSTVKAAVAKVISKHTPWSRETARGFLEHAGNVDLAVAAIDFALVLNVDPVCALRFIREQNKAI